MNEASSVIFNIGVHFTDGVQYDVNIYKVGYTTILFGDKHVCLNKKKPGYGLLKLQLFPQIGEFQ